MIYFFLLIFSIDRFDLKIFTLYIKIENKSNMKKDLLKLYYQILFVCALESEKGYHYGLPSLNSKDINLLYFGNPHLSDDHIPTKTYT
jgi:hypothetical protein